MADIQTYDIRSFCKAYGVSRSFVYLEIKAGRRTLQEQADGEVTHELPTAGVMMSILTKY